MSTHDAGKDPTTDQSTDTTKVQFDKSASYLGVRVTGYLQKKKWFKDNRVNTCSNLETWSVRHNLLVTQHVGECPFQKALVLPFSRHLHRLLLVPSIGFGLNLSGLFSLSLLLNLNQKTKQNKNFWQGGTPVNLFNFRDFLKPFWVVYLPDDIAPL